MLLFLDAVQAWSGAASVALKRCAALQFRAALHARSLQSFWRQLLAPIASGAASEAATVLLDSVQAGMEVSPLHNSACSALWLSGVGCEHSGVICLACP